MNLGQIGVKVQRELRYAPSTFDWKEDLYGVIGRVNDRLLMERSWPFMLRRAPLIAFPDTPIPKADLSWVSTHQFEVTNAALVAAGLYPSAAFAAYYQWLLEGCEVWSDPGPLADGNWGEAPFVIEKVLTGVVRFWLDPRSLINSFLFGDPGLSIVQRRIQLPPDCHDLIALWDDQGRPIRAATPEEGRRLHSQPAPSGGTPQRFTEDYGFQGGSPPRSIIAPAWLRSDQYSREAMVVRIDTWTAAASAGGNWPDGVWEVAICWKYAGMLGPLTEPKEVIFGGGSNTMELAGLPNNGDIPDTFGRRLAVYARRRDNVVPYVLVNEMPAAGASEATASFSSPQDVDGTPLPFNIPSYDDDAGPYRSIQLWPRSDRFRKLEIEYRLRPAPLQYSGDTPPFPPQYHELLVYLAALEIAGRDDQVFAQRCERNAEPYMRQLLREFPGARFRWQKGMAGVSDERLPFFDRDSIRYTP